MSYDYSGIGRKRRGENNNGGGGVVIKAELDRRMDDCRCWMMGVKMGWVMGPKMGWYSILQQKGQIIAGRLRLYCILLYCNIPCIIGWMGQCIITLSSKVSNNATLSTYSYINYLFLYKCTNIVSGEQEAIVVACNRGR